MVVQVVNTGTDLGHDQFDLAIPGGGQGAIQGYAMPLHLVEDLLIRVVVRRNSANPKFGALNTVVYPTERTATPCPNP